MLRRRRLVLAAMLVTCLSVHLSAEMGPPISTGKKILGFACDLVDTTYLKNNIAELERIPIDGLILSVHPDSEKIAEGELYLGRVQLASGPRFRTQSDDRPGCR